MPHIHTEPGQVDQTATAYIALVTPGKEPKMLLHMHKKLGVLLPLGGHVELNETVWMAAAHEVQEESGYHLEQLRVMQPPLRIKNSFGSNTLHPQPVLLNTHTFNALDEHYHGDTVFFLTTTELPADRPMDGESADVRMLTRNEIAALTSSEIYVDTKNTALHLLDHFVDGWVPVPATDFSLKMPKR